MKKRYIVFGLIVLFNLPGIIASLASRNYFSFNILFLIALVYTIYFISKVEKEGQTGSELTQNEKIQVLITELFNPLIAGAFYYYCWKNQFPKKAKQANSYSWVIFGIMLVAGFILNQTGLVKLF